MIYTASLKGPRNGNKKRSQHRVVFISRLERSEGERRPTALATEPRLVRPADGGSGARAACEPPESRNAAEGGERLRLGKGLQRAMQRHGNEKGKT